MKKYFIMAGLVLTTALAFVSCEEKDYSSYPPTWKGFAFYRDGQQITSRSVCGGDEITFVAQQDRKGHLINSTYYDWKLTFSVDSLGADNIHYFPITTIDTRQHTNYDGTSNADPQWKVQLPANAMGQATLSFTASYNYSGSGIQVSNGSTYDQSGSATGSISSTSGSMSGGAKGTLKFNITAKN